MLHAKCKTIKSANFRKTCESNFTVTAYWKLCFYCCFSSHLCSLLLVSMVKDGEHDKTQMVIHAPSITATMTTILIMRSLDLLEPSSTDLRPLAFTCTACSACWFSDWVKPPVNDCVAFTLCLDYFTKSNVLQPASAHMQSLKKWENAVNSKATVLSVAHQSLITV